jgi:hypothetical protein
MIILQEIYKCDLLLWDEDIIPGVTPMVEVNHVTEMLSSGERIANKGCLKCNNIEEMMMALETREIADWKLKYMDAKKNIKWMGLVLFICLGFFSISISINIIGTKVVE